MKKIVITLILLISVSSFGRGVCDHLLEHNRTAVPLAECSTNLHGSRIMSPKINLCLYKVVNGSHSYYQLFGDLVYRQQNGSDVAIDLSFVRSELGKHYSVVDKTEAGEDGLGVNLKYQSLDVGIETLMVYGVRHVDLYLNKRTGKLSLIYFDDHWFFSDLMFEAELDCH